MIGAGGLGCEILSNLAMSEPDPRLAAQPSSHHAGSPETSPLTATSRHSLGPLSPVGFKDITVIDMDTIDVSAWTCRQS